MSQDDPQWTAPGRPGASGPPGEGSGAMPPGGPVPVPGQWSPSVPVSTTPLYAEYRPGIVPLRPLLVSDILNGVTTAIRGNPAATLGLGLVTTLVFAIPAAFLGAWLATWAADRFTEAFSSDGTGAGADVGPLFGELGSLVPSLASSAAVLLMIAFMAHVIGQGVIGRKTSLAETWAGTRSRLLPVVGSALLLGLLIVAAGGLCLGGPVVLLATAASGSGSDGAFAGGVVAVVVGGLATVLLVIFLTIRFSFSSSAIVLEQLGVIAGMRRSWRLTSGQQFWRILGIRILVGLMTGIAGQILTFPITFGLGAALGATTDSPYSITVGTVFIAALASVIVGTLTTPFSAGTSTLLYIDQRIRREALDVQLVRAAQAGA